MKLIYTLRSQCDDCKLDKMEVFYRIKDSTPSEFVKQLKPLITAKFRKAYGCSHRITFTRETDKTYKWDELTNKPVLR